MKRKVLALFAAAAFMMAILSGCGSKSVTVEEARKGVARVGKFVTVEVYTVEDGKLADYVTSVDNLLWSTGTAFGVGRTGQPTDIFVTNHHVIADIDAPTVLDTDAEGNPTLAGVAKVTGIYILLDNFAYKDGVGLDASRAVPCNIICSEEQSGADIAILRAAEPVSGRIALPLQDAESSLSVNDSVTALGYPGSSDDATSEGSPLAEVGDVTVTAGAVSRFYNPSSVGGNEGILDNSRYIQHTAITNHGNSGGPLIDKNGAVVGVNTNIIQGEEYAESTASYALRIKYAKDALNSLEIQYDVYKAGPNVLVPALIAAAVVAAAAAVVALAKRKKPVPGPADPITPVMNSASSSAELRIQGQSGTFAGRRFSINGQVRIGRDPAANDLVYPAGAPGISGRHCVITLSGGQVTVTDLGSSYGTFLDGGRKLAPNQPTPLRIGDRFCLGSEKESFVITGKGGSLS